MGSLKNCAAGRVPRRPPTGVPGFTIVRLDRMAGLHGYVPSRAVPLRSSTVGYHNSPGKSRRAAPRLLFSAGRLVGAGLPPQPVRQGFFGFNLSPAGARPRNPSGAPRGTKNLPDGFPDGFGGRCGAVRDRARRCHNRFAHGGAAVCGGVGALG